MAAQPLAAPAGTEVHADLFAQEGRDILYAMGHVRLQRGGDLITADAAVIWYSQREAYLEGRVIYRTGQSVVEAERAYIHWSSTRDEATGGERTAVDRGFLFRADVRWQERPDQVPWHIKADELLQTDVKHFVAERRVTLSPCQYYEPHVYFTAERVDLIGDESIVATDLKYYVRKTWIPPFYWPQLYVPLGWDWPRMRIDAGSSSRYGAYVKTEVLYDLPKGTLPLLKAEVGVRADFMSKRGPAYGLIFRYQSDIQGRERDFRGELDFYHVPFDHGRDANYGSDTNRGQLGEHNRYRVKFWHSQDMPEGWEFDFEFSKYSDAGFRREYFEREYYEGRPIQNRAYLKYSDGPLSAFLHYRWREDDFLDATEYLPQVGVNLMSVPIWGNLLYSRHIEYARVRRRLANVRLGFLEDAEDPDVIDRLRDENFHPHPLRNTLTDELTDDESFGRFSMSHMLALPFQADIWHIEPFVGYRMDQYGRSADGDDSTWRHLFFFGGRISADFWQAWDDIKLDGLRSGGAKILPLDVNGLRHVVTPELRVMSIWGSGTENVVPMDVNDETQPPADVGFRRRFRRYEPYDPIGIQFGDVNDISPVTVVSLGLRNRWQTRRGDRVVNLLDIEPSINYYHHDNDDPFNKSRADFRTRLDFRPIDGVDFFGDFAINLIQDDKTLGPEWNDKGDREIRGPRGSGAPDYVDLGLTIATSKDWELTVTGRYDIFDGFSLGTSLGYILSEKWRAVLQLETGSQGLLSLRLTRDLHDWDAEFIIENDRSSNNRVIGIRLSPKTRQQLITGLYYTRDLAAGFNAYRQEAYQQYDY